MKCLGLWGSPEIGASQNREARKIYEDSQMIAVRSPPFDNDRILATPIPVTSTLQKVFVYDSRRVLTLGLG